MLLARARFSQTSSFNGATSTSFLFHIALHCVTLPFILLHHMSTTVFVVHPLSSSILYHPIIFLWYIVVHPRILQNLGSVCIVKKLLFLGFALFLGPQFRSTPGAALIWTSAQFGSSAVILIRVTNVRSEASKGRTTDRTFGPRAP